MLEKILCDYNSTVPACSCTERRVRVVALGTGFHFTEMLVSLPRTVRKYDFSVLVLIRESPTFGKIHEGTSHFQDNKNVRNQDQLAALSISPSRPQWRYVLASKVHAKYSLAPFPTE